MICLNGIEFTFKEVYRKEEDKIWFYYEYRAGEAIILKSTEFNCAIGLLYEGVSFKQVLEATER